MTFLNNEKLLQISKCSLSEIYKKGLGELDKMIAEPQVIQDSWSNIMVVEELPQNPEPNCIYLKYDDKRSTYISYIHPDNEWQEIESLVVDDSYYQGFIDLNFQDDSYCQGFIDLNFQDIVMYDREN